MNILVWWSYSNLKLGTVEKLRDKWSWKCNEGSWFYIFLSPVCSQCRIFLYRRRECALLVSQKPILKISLQYHHVWRAEKGRNTNNQQQNKKHSNPFLCFVMAYTYSTPTTYRLQHIIIIIKSFTSYNQLWIRKSSCLDKDWTKIVLPFQIHTHEKWRFVHSFFSA